MRCVAARTRTDPREIEGDLLAVIGAHVVQRLVLVPAAVARPVLVEDLPRVQGLRVVLARRQPVGTLWTAQHT